MNHLQDYKAMAEQMLALSAELLRLIQEDESKNCAFIESAKKTPVTT